MSGLHSNRVGQPFRAAAGIVAGTLLLLVVSCSSRKTALTHPALPAPPQAESPEPDNWKEAADFFRMKRWQSEGDIPVDRYLAARDQLRRLPVVSVAGATLASNKAKDATFGTWQPLGPGNIGGRVRGLVIDPQNPATMYAGTASGGVMKTTNGGQFWTPLTDFLPVLTISSLVMDPSSSSTLYLGTGEVARGAGIFKSTDSGATWTQLPQTANPNFYSVYSLAIVPTRPSHIYAGTSNGLFFSSDSGATWTKTLPSGSSTASCRSVKVRGDQPTDIVFAACEQFTNNALTDTIYRNKDAGGSGTWETVKTDPGMGSTNLAISPSNPTTVYAVSASNDSKSQFASALFAVFRSTQGGDSGSWETRATPADPNSVNANILSYPQCSYPVDHHGQGGYNLDIAVDPTTPDVVFIAGIVVFRSDDGGATWGYANGASAGYIHDDQHILVFHPNYDGAANQTLFAGNDGGVYFTNKARGVTAKGANALCGVSPDVGWTSYNHTFAATQFYFGTVFPGGATYFGGTQDNGTPLGADAGGVNQWTSVYGGDGGQVAVDPLDPNNMFYEYIHLAIRKSTDGALNNHSSITGITEDPNNFQFINYFVLDPQDPLKMYTGGHQLWRSFDGADNWAAASAPFAAVSSFESISTVSVDPKDSNHVLFGSSAGGRVFRNTAALTADGTTVWPFSTPRAGYVSNIAFDPNHPGRIYATYATFRSSASQSEIYRSDDAGLTWIPLGLTGSATLPDIPVHVLLVDPDDSTRLYIGTDTGVLASFDSGQTWARDDTPFADAITETLSIQRAGAAKYLYAFTHGRGVWRVNLAGGAASCTYALSQSSVTVDANAQAGAIKVTTDPSCSWSARPGSKFVTIQSPATGNGPGTVYYRVSSNQLAITRSDSFLIQDQPVTVVQNSDATLPHSIKNDELATAKIVNSLPYDDQSQNSSFTANPNDPVHSCTKSADNKTQWWRYTASASNRIIVTVQGRALNFYGDSGIALTVYPLAGGVLGNELACAAIPQSSTDPTTTSVQFDAVSGSSYAIEISGTNSNTAQVTMSVSILPAVSLTPANPTVVAGQKQQFSANILNTPNTAVRWTLSAPVGSIDPTGLYTAPAQLETPAKVTVMARSFANPNATASSAVTIQPPPVSFTAAGVTNAASFQNGAVAPGEIITIFGTRLGPLTLAGLALDANGFVSSNIGDTQVLFDGVAAPLIYTLSGQLSAVVPYDVAGHASTSVQVKHAGSISAAVNLPVTDAAPALFTAASSGSGPAAIVNQDGLINSAQFAAARNSVVLLYGTGEGQTNPPGVNGLVATQVFPKPVLSVTVQIDNKNADVLYAGIAPGDVAGVLQINARVPANATAGNVPVVVTVGTHSSRSDVSINVLGPDGRSAQVAYNNTGTTPVTISVYQPGDFSNPIQLGSVAGGKFPYVGTQVVGSDWGIQVNSSPIRVVSQVCDFMPNGTPPYWRCTGNAAAPFPR